MLEIGCKPSQVILIVFLDPKYTKDKCFHCAMDLGYCFRWLSMVPSHRIIALWVHPFRAHISLESSRGVKPQSDDYV